MVFYGSLSHMHEVSFLVKEAGSRVFIKAYHLHQEPNITFSVIKSTVRDELHLRIAEAYEIQSQRPALNRKREDMGTGFLA